MARRRFPDWLLYGGVAAAILTIGQAWRENADAPAPAESKPSPAKVASPLDVVLRVEDAAQGPNSGTAFSAGPGVWLTARHVVETCPQPALMTGEGRAVAARAALDSDGDIAVLLTEGGAPPLPLGNEAGLVHGQRGFHPGYPLGKPGEATSRLIGRETLASRGRGGRGQPVLAWAEAGRTEGISGPLSGLSGAPVLDEAGRVVGVTIAQSPRRGRIYTTTPGAIRQALAAAGERAPRRARAEPIAADTYYQAASELRAQLRVVQVLCAEASGAA